MSVHSAPELQTGCHTPPGERRIAPGVWLWLALGVGLVVMFAVVDKPVATALNSTLKSHQTHLLNHTIRWLGIGWVQLLAILLLFGAGALRRRSLLAAAWCALLAFATSAALSSALKVLVHRPRPEADLALTGSWLGNVQLALHHSELNSFPSGESTCTFALATAVGACLPRLRPYLFIIAVLVATARVLVRAHFPSDVWAGAMLGIFSGQLALRLLKPKADPGLRPKAKKEPQ